MIPFLVPRKQLLAANGLFTFTQNAAFAIGFALLGPLVVKLAGPEALILMVAALYLVAMVFTITLPSAPSAEESAHPRRPPSRAPSRRWPRSSPSCARAGLHPGPPERHLVAHLPRRHGIAHRRPGRARAGLRDRDPRSQPQRLRGRGAAPRDGHRDRHPPAQRVRPVPAPPADDGGRPRRPRDPPRGARGGRSDHPLPAAGGGGDTGRPVRLRLPPVGRGRRSPSWPASATRSSRSPPRPASRRSCPRRSEGECSGS